MPRKSSRYVNIYPYDVNCDMKVKISKFDTTKISSKIIENISNKLLLIIYKNISQNIHSRLGY